MTPETTSILLRAADRVEFKGWCQQDSAVTQNGAVVMGSNAKASKWCGTGVIHKESDVLCEAEIGKHSHEEYQRWGQTRGGDRPFLIAVLAVDRLLKRIGYRGRLSDYNDTRGRTAAEVAHLLRAAALEGLWA